MASNPFDQFFQTTPAQPQQTAPAPVSAPAASPAAGENPFSSFFPAAAQVAPNTSSAAAPQAAPQEAGQGYSNPFNEFFPRPDTKGPEAPTTEQTVENGPKPSKPVPSYEDRFGTGESILTRPISTYFGIPEYREEAGGIEKGAEKFLSSLTSPVSLALMLATAGTSSIASAGEAALAEAAEVGMAGEGAASAQTFGANVLNWVSEKFGAEEAAQVGKWAGTIDKVATAGFALDQIRGFAAQVPEIQSDIKAGDWESAKEHITTASLGAVFAVASINHLITKTGLEKFNWTPDNKALGEQQGSIEIAKQTARKIDSDHQPVLKAQAEEMTTKLGIEITPHDLDVAMKWYHEAGGLKNEIGEPEGYTGPERRGIPRTAPLGATELEEAVAKRAPVQTPFDVTEGAKGTVESDPNMPATPGQETVSQAAAPTVAATAGAPADYKPISDTMATLRDQKEEIGKLKHLSPRDKARMLRNIELAMSLPTKLKQVAESFRSFYKEHWDRYYKAGIVHEEKQPQENYAGNRQYHPEDENLSAFRPSEGTRRATKTPAHLKARSFDNMLDGLKKGWVPKQIGMVEAAANYEVEAGRTHGLAEAEKVFLRHEDTDGRPVAIEPSRIRYIDSISPSGRSIKIPSIRIDDISSIVDNDHIQQDPDGKFWLDVSDYVEGPKSFKRFRVTDVALERGPEGGPALDSEGNFIEKPIRKETALMFHPDHIQRVKQAFDDTSWVSKTPWMNAILKSSQFAKKTLLSLSPFHYATEALRGLQTGLGIHEIYHPQEIDPAGLAATEGVKHGLVLLGDHVERSSYRAAADSYATGGGGLIGKIPGLREIQSIAEDHLFGSWLPRMKAIAFDKMAKDLREQNPNWGSDQVYATSARLTNATFGGMNWKQLGVSANTVDFLRMVALAPDFTGSQIDYTMQAFKPGGSVVAKSFGRMMFYNFLAAQAINLMIHGTVHMEHPFGVVSPDEKTVVSMRTMPEDVWRSLTETKSFARNRLNPLLKTGVEELYGRNDQGKKLSDEQMIGDAIRNVSPISLQKGGLEAFKFFAPNQTRKFQTGNQEDTFLQSLGRAVGIGVSANRTAAETLASQRLNDRLPAGVSDPSQVQRHHKVLDAADQLRSGHSVDLHEFTPTERRQILTMGREDLLRSKFGRLNMGDALDVWKISTEEEKQKLLPDLLKKKTSYIQKLSAAEREEDTTFQRLKAMGLTKMSGPKEEP